MNGEPREPQWMRELRFIAGERFDRMSWPAPSEEEWRRTDVSSLDLNSYAAEPAAGVEAETASTSDQSLMGCKAAAGCIFFKSARCVRRELKRELREKGVGLLPLDRALAEFQHPLQDIFQSAILGADNRFMAWHYGALSHGVLLFIPPFLEIREPFLLDFIESGSGTLRSPHVVILIGEGSRARVVQRMTSPDVPGRKERAEYRSGGGAGRKVLCNAGLDIKLSDSARLEYFATQDLDPESLYFLHARADVGREGSLRTIDATFGAGLVKTRFECALEGSGSEAFLDGAYFCKGGQHMDIRTVQRHRAPSATSRAYYKGAVAGGGRTVFQGLIEVETGASGTDAFLSNKNLILGDTARSDSIPTLKIGNNNVKCSHGSTTGRLSEEERFYLMSRGFSPQEADEMLVVGYFEELLGRAPDVFNKNVLRSIRARLRRDRDNGAQAA